MITVAELVKSKDLFVLHGISISGALNTSPLSIQERYRHTVNKTTKISAFTFKCNSDDLGKHFFLYQGFIVKDGNIIHADKKDSGIMNINYIDKYKEPQIICDLNSVIDPNRESYNEILISQVQIFGFYFRAKGDGKICYTLNQIISDCKKLSLPIYFFNGLKFIRYKRENGKELFSEELTTSKIFI